MSNFTAEQIVKINEISQSEIEEMKFLAESSTAREI